MAGNGDSNNELFPGYSGWGDPEAYGAAQASTTMEPAVTNYLHDVVTGQMALRGLERLQTPYDSNQSLAQNALNPQSLETATNIALSVGPGMIAGPKALRQPEYASKVDDLDRFRDLEQNTAGWPHQSLDERRDMFEQTGWFRGPDGLARFIIPDANAKLNFDNLDQVVSKNGDINYFVPPGSDLKLSDVMDHPDLFSAYPHLRDIPITSAAGKGGAFNPITGKISIAGAQAPNFKSTLLHETQHAVQDYEGFARGGNYREFLPPNFNTDMSIAQNNYNVMHDVLVKNGHDPYAVSGDLGIFPYDRKINAFDGKSTAVPVDMLKNYVDAANEYDRFGKINTQAINRYRSLAGEVEARTTQAMDYKRNWNLLPQDIGTLERDFMTNKMSVQPYPSEDQQIVIGKGEKPAPISYYYNPETKTAHPVEPMPEAFNPFLHLLTPVDHDPFAITPGGPQE